ncbi:MAG: phosphomannomutase/phosphoglucomutase [Actinomycetes bacterium]
MYSWGFEPAALDQVIKAYDVRGLVGSQLTEDLAYAVGTAFALFVSDAKSVVIGEDMRPSSPSLASAFADGVMDQGIDVVRIGLASTDQLYFASGFLGVPGAMFTASHNPAAYNGIKLCRAGAAPVGKESGLTQIREQILGSAPPLASHRGSVRHQDLLTEYAHHLLSLVDLSQMRPLKIVVDAGNGMGGHTVPTVFASLPITLTQLFFELDGSFPNHEANPIEPANMRDLQSAVIKAGADIGLAFDGDADRCFIVDERGEIVSPSTLTALIAARELVRKPGSTIIHNLITSRSVKEVVEELGGRAVRSRVGHSYIKAQMAEESALFGGEHSGHFYFADFWNADSGMLAALHAMSALGNAAEGTKLSAVLRPYDRYVASGEINSTVADSLSKMKEIELIYASHEGIEVDHLDGITISAKQWWFNVRASNTEPLLRLNVEAKDIVTMEQLRDEVLGVIRS